MHLGLTRKQEILKMVTSALFEDFFKPYNTEAEEVFKEYLESRRTLMSHYLSAAPILDRAVTTSIVNGGYSGSDFFFSVNSMHNIYVLSNLNTSYIYKGPSLESYVYFPEVAKKGGPQFDKPIAVETLDDSSPYYEYEKMATSKLSMRRKTVTTEFKETKPESRDHGAVFNFLPTHVMYDPDGSISNRFFELQKTFEQCATNYYKAIINSYNFLVEVNTLEQVTENWPALKVIIPPQWVEEAEAKKREAEERRKQKLIREQVTAARDMANNRKTIGAELNNTIGKELYAKKLTGEI